MKHWEMSIEVEVSGTTYFKFKKLPIGFHEEQQLQAFLNYYVKSWEENGVWIDEPNALPKWYAPSTLRTIQPVTRQPV